MPFHSGRSGALVFSPFGEHKEAKTGQNDKWFTEGKTFIHFSSGRINPFPSPGPQTGPEKLS